MLADERPFVRITEPPKMSLATPTAVLPVTLSAEDDCGISRLQLFRSLNDSRPLPFDLPLPPRPPRRLDESVRLPLDRYGLEPGDVIKLFGRVEDNDPAGAKGAESSVVTVRIVSQEEFEQMLQTRQGHRGHALEILRRPAPHGIAGQEDGRPAEEDERAAGRREAVGRDAPRARAACRGDAPRGRRKSASRPTRRCPTISTRPHARVAAIGQDCRRRWPRNWRSSSGRKTC